MPGGMDHDRNKLGPSLDIRIRGSSQEPTLNGSVRLSSLGRVSVDQTLVFVGSREDVWVADEPRCSVFSLLAAHSEFPPVVPAAA